MPTQPQTKRPSRPSAAPRRKPSPSRIPLRPLIGAGVIALTLAAAFFLQYRIFPDGKMLGIKRPSDHAVVQIMTGGAVRINEVMSANASAVLDASGSAPDWIELINTSSAPVDLKGYTLAKTANTNAQFTFPAHTLQPGECVLVFADSRLRNAPGSEYHAPFRLSSAGDTLLLFNASGTAIDTVNLPALAQNESYLRQSKSKWEKTQQCTPGLANTDESYRSLREVTLSSPLQLTELMASNASYAPDETGLFQDYIELYNASSEPISLKGFRLSDTRDNTARWQFPDITLGAGEYLLVYASGLDRRAADRPLHTGFRLSSSGESVVLTNAAGQLLDAVDFPALNADQAYSRQADGSWTTQLPPTPGAANGN